MRFECKKEPLVAFLLLVAMPFAPSNTAIRVQVASSLLRPILDPLLETLEDARICGRRLSSSGPSLNALVMVQTMCRGGPLAHSSNSQMRCRTQDIYDIYIYMFFPQTVDTLGVLTVGEKQLMLRSLKRAGVNG